MDNGWLESSAHLLLKEANTSPFVDKLHVAECMNPGWTLTNSPGSFFGENYRDGFQKGIIESVGYNRWIPEGSEVLHHKLKTVTDKSVDKIASRSQLIGAIQTSAWFELDGDMYSSAITATDGDFNQIGTDGLYEWKAHDLELSELPPLPFKRMLYQTRDVDTNRPSLMLASAKDPDKEGMYLGCPLIIVWEVIPGERWDCLSYFIAPNGIFCPVYRFSPKGMEDDYAPGWEPDSYDRDMASVIFNAAVACAHLVTARNIVTYPGLSHKKERKALKRLRYAPVEATQYRVRMAYTIQAKPSGVSDREYRVRWLVRGHWRYFQDGRRTWVRPYIKGPIGAPWKGRPIHSLGVLDRKV